MVHPALKARRRLVFCDIILYWRTVDSVSLSDFHRRLNFSQSVKSTLPLYRLKWERLDNFSVASMPAHFFIMSVSYVSLGPIIHMTVAAIIFYRDGSELLLEY